MLCEISETGGSLFITWLGMSVLETIFLFLTSAPVFYYYYWGDQVTYEKWRYKSNPKFPSPQKVRDEIVQMMKGMFCATVCPAISLELARQGLSQAFCGWGGRPLSYHIGTFLLCWLVADLFEFSYHRLGHLDLRFWNHHRHHHVFHNPSPFSVIADEPVDQLFRSSPLLFIPLIIPINMDLLFIQNIFPGEKKLVRIKNRILNTSFQHYAHHARSSMNTPYHCGFFLKLWDQLLGGLYPTEEKGCFCAECARGKGERTVEEWNKVQRIDYSPLLRPSFWLSWQTFKIEARE